MWTTEIMELSFNKHMELSVSFNHILFTCTICTRSDVMAVIHSIHKGY